MKPGNCLLGALVLWFYFGGKIFWMTKKVRRSPLDFIPHFCLLSNGMAYDFTVDMDDRVFDFILLYDGWIRCSTKEKVLSRWGKDHNLLNFDL
jgi:hypothetical protein